MQVVRKALLVILISQLGCNNLNQLLSTGTHYGDILYLQIIITGLLSNSELQNNTPYFKQQEHHRQLGVNSDATLKWVKKLV